MKKIFAAIAVLTLLASCQKEASFNSDNPANTGSSGGVGGGTNNTNGDLLVKALQISPATSDTNVIAFTWNSNKKLLSYTSNGKVQGIVTKISHDIARNANGNVTKIISKTFIGGIISDSVAYTYYYKGSNAAYILGARETFLGPLNDSIVLTYNSSNQLAVKETFTDLLGTLAPSSKESYQYDGAGNVKIITGYAADFFTGTYSQSGVTTYSFDNHKAAVVLGEECYVVMGVPNMSKNNISKMVTNNVASGTTYTTTFSGATFNSFDRPAQASASITPQPPGYNQKLIYYYQ